MQRTMFAYALRAGLGRVSCNPRLHDMLHELAQRVVGRDLVELKRPGALFAWQESARRQRGRCGWVRLRAGGAARTSPPG